MLSSAASFDARWHRTPRCGSQPDVMSTDPLANSVQPNGLFGHIQSQQQQQHLQDQQHQMQQQQQQQQQIQHQQQPDQQHFKSLLFHNGTDQIPHFTSSAFTLQDNSTGSKLTFKEQVTNTSTWFQDLRPSEQVMLLVSLVRQLNSVYLKMFVNVMEQLMKNVPQEISKLESEANDTDSVLSLRPCPAADITAHLSNRLPLLRHDASPSLRRAYVDLMRQVRLAAPDTCRSLEDCRHLFSLALLHPAFSTEDRLQIQELVFNGYGPPGCGSGNGRGSRSPLSPSQPLRADSGLGLDQMPTSGGFQCGYPELTNTAAAAAATNSSASALSSVFLPPQASSQPPTRAHQPLSRQLSLAPSSSSSSSSTAAVGGSGGPPPLSTASSAPSPVVGGGAGGLHPSSPNSSGFLSGSESHAPLSPQSSASSSGEDGLGGLTSVTAGRSSTRPFSEKSGMRNVPTWLKSLRLHKYATLFQHLSYDEMQSISDEWLEAQNVTKGARNKILVSIRRLRDRQEQLRRLEVELSSSSSSAQSLRNCLLELRAVLASPVRRFDGPESAPKAKVEEGDLPGQVVHCLWKAVSLMLVSRRYEEEHCSLLTQIVDGILDNEAFTDRQRNLASKWRQEVESSRGPTFRKYLWEHPQPGSPGGGLKPALGCKKPLASQWSGPLKPNFVPNGSSGALRGGNGGAYLVTSTACGFMEGAGSPAFLPLAPQPSDHLPLAKNNSFGAPPPRAQVERTHSAPGCGVLPGFFPTAVGHLGLSCDDVGDEVGSCEDRQLDDINRSLDLLAKKVTEAAIGDSDLSGE